MLFGGHTAWMGPLNRAIGDHAFGKAVRMVLQTLLLRRNFPCPHFFGSAKARNRPILLKNPELERWR
jgi:hypothetical protein